MQSFHTPHSRSPDTSIYQQLLSLIPDSILIDENFDVMVMSQTVLDLLEFSEQDVRGRNINSFACSADFLSYLKESIIAGYFKEKRTYLLNKTNHRILVDISGFHVGLISDQNGHIILKVGRLDAVGAINQLLKKKAAELDNFVYQAAHDLRGPLATMKGLINLLKLRTDNAEVDRIILMLGAHANKLDERLFQLVYLSQPDQQKEISPRAADFSTLETTLRKIIEQNAFVDFLEFRYASPMEKIEGIHNGLLSSLLVNMLHYLLSLQMRIPYVKVLFLLSLGDGQLSVTVVAQGFETTASMRAAIHQSESAYTDMIHYPQLLHFYAAQKIARQLNAELRVDFFGTDKQRLAAFLPLQHART